MKGNDAVPVYNDDINMRFSTFFDLLPKIAPRRWVVTSLSTLNHARTTIFWYKCPVISVAHQIQRDK